MGKIYQGESLNLVFRCRNSDGSDASLWGTEISVLMKDGFGEVVHRFSTVPAEGVRQAEMSGSYVICRLDRLATAHLAGTYTIEVKVRKGKGELVMIDIVKGIKIYASAIGEEVNL